MFVEAKDPHYPPSNHLSVYPNLPDGSAQFVTMNQ
jgi:hypothetical protein